MKLNLGCGGKMIREENWLNIDSRKLAPEDTMFLRHDIRRLLNQVVRAGSAEHILMDDVLEHFSRPEAEQLIRDVYTMLRPGGTCRIKTPVIHLLLKWGIEHDHVNTIFRWYGGNDYPENCHKYCWGEDDLVAFLKAVGFKLVKLDHMEDTNAVIEVKK